MGDVRDCGKTIQLKGAKGKKDTQEKLPIFNYAA
jgi:hypothetical protein